LAGGRANSFLPRPFSGLIDEPSIFARALSQPEIQAIYDSGSNGKCHLGSRQLSLQIAHGPDFGVIIWPVGSEGRLQETTDPFPPVVWAIKEAAREIVGDQNTLTVNFSTGRRYYRLIK